MHPIESTHRRVFVRRAVWLLPLLVFLLGTGTAALKCRTDDGPSEAELKRITRACMRKIGEQARGSNSNVAASGSAASSSSHYNSNNNRNSNNFYGPLHQSNYGANRYDYDDRDDDTNEHYNSNGNNYNYNANSNNYNYNNGNGNYERDRDRDRGNGNNRNILQQRNRERQQNTRGGANSAPTMSTMNNERRYEYGSNNGMANGNGNNGGGGGNAGSGGGGGNGGARNSGNPNNGYSSSNSNGNNQRGNNSNRKVDNNKNNNDTFDAACVVHCFFEQMNMLNSDDYPDRYKVQYGLTRELRDRELRNFYTDTIQNCFHYLESQRRRDKCHYSRELINCMGEYAKANCDDWKEYSVIFN